MTVKFIFLALECFLLILFLTPLPVICSGNIAGILACAVLITVTARFGQFRGLIGKLWGRVPGRVLVIACGAVIMAGLIYVTVLSVLMYRAQEHRPEETRTIVVLGCKVRGERPTRMLRRRLEAAKQALDAHPEAICIVSGGQGENEIVSEALAMKNYLVELGVDEERIIMEDRSTSTYENIKFSLEIMEERGLGKDMTIVTDGFHQYRASLIARAQGVEQVTSWPAYTEPRYLFTYWVREWLGLTHFFLLGN